MGSAMETPTFCLLERNGVALSLRMTFLADWQMTVIASHDSFCAWNALLLCSFFLLSSWPSELLLTPLSHHHSSLLLNQFWTRLDQEAKRHAALHHMIS